MLSIVVFTEKRFKKYGLQNTWTGIVLPKSFYTKRGAGRHARRVTRNLNRTIANLRN